LAAGAQPVSFRHQGRDRSAASASSRSARAAKAEIALSDRAPSAAKSVRAPGELSLKPFDVGLEGRDMPFEGNHERRIVRDGVSPDVRGAAV